MPTLYTYNLHTIWLIDWLIDWLSGGFTPCRHLRRSPGREHTVITSSVRWWWLLDESNLPPAHDPLLFSKSGMGSFMLSHTNPAGHIPRPLCIGSHEPLPGLHIYLRYRLKNTLKPMKWNIFHFSLDPLPPPLRSEIPSYIWLHSMTVNTSMKPIYFEKVK